MDECIEPEETSSLTFKIGGVLSFLGFCILVFGIDISILLVLISENIVDNRIEIRDSLYIAVVGGTIWRFGDYLRSF